MKHDYDVIIIGGGMVGATLAVQLSTDPSLSIAVLEANQNRPLSASDKPELRVSAITQASENILKNLGIWSLLLPNRLSKFTDMKVWETHNSMLHFDSAEVGEPRLGHIIENTHIQQAALSKCKQQANIDVVCPVKLTQLDERSLHLDNGRVISARLIVGADGAQSLLREQLNIDSRGWDYDQSGVVCTVTTENSHQYTAWQRFLPDGPLAFLPLADPHQCSIVWSTSSEEAELLLELDDEGFKSVLAKAFEHQLGEVTEVSQRAVFPLKLRHAAQYIKEGFALVGDAAHTIHPLAGQGVNIGFLDAATLAEVVLDAQSKGRNIGSIHTLSKYQRRRKGDNLAIQMTMDVFKRVFGSELAPIRWARRFGLSKVNHTSILKNIFIKQASGHRFANPEISKTLYR